ncbi:MAG: GspL/Epsl periplasmic domain-containing protein [Dissulfurispiraceae bacterium]|jgi:type II secretory pathway component PulL
MKAAFFDLVGEELTVFTLEKNGTTYVSGVASSIPPSEEYSESCLSLPLSLLNFRVVEVPFQDEKKLRELLPFEIDGLILGGHDTIVFDTYPLQGGDEKHKVLVAYVLKDTLRTLLNKLKSSGFDPKAVTSIELSDAIGSSASESEIMGRILLPGTLVREDRARIAVKEMESPTVNLRRDEFAYTADTEKAKKSLRVTALLAALLFVVFLSDMVLTTWSVKSANSSIKDDLRRTYLSIFPNEKRISSEVYQLRAHLKELQDKESTFIGVSPLQVLLDLTRLSRPGVSLNEITVDRDLIVVKGECPSLSDVQKIKSDLEGFLASVTISDTKASVQNRTLFTITGKEKK